VNLRGFELVRPVMEKFPKYFRAEGGFTMRRWANEFWAVGVVYGDAWSKSSLKLFASSRDPRGLRGKANSIAGMILPLTRCALGLKSVEAWSN
jgi:hypothetical protein